MGIQVAAAQASGSLKEFNLRYKHARQQAEKNGQRFPTYSMARARLEAALAVCASTGRRSISRKSLRRRRKPITTVGDYSNPSLKAVFSICHARRRQTVRIAIVADCRARTASRATLADLARTTTHVTDIDEFFKHSDIRHRYFGPALPTSTTIEVRRLALPDYLVEIDALAIV
jgi:hypothetical protein